ncbi:MAG: hypothetical protein Q8K78_07045 [Planctomycetaceae bacterium]|nr:hypothetical protein [Planctomycetaceae bacterium]
MNFENRTIAILSFMAMALFLTPVTVATAKDPVDSDEKDPHFEYLVQRLKRLSVHVGDTARDIAELQTKPLFRWQNPVSGADGAVFVWTVQDRPLALAKIHVNDQRKCYVESMTGTTPKTFEIRRDGAVYWAPAKSDVSPRKFTDVGPPAEANGARLTQMRAIARRFRFTSLWGEENRSEWELRVLSTPLYRYGNPDTGLIDGALFGYAQGTNPEAVVIVEALKTRDRTVWEASPVRLSGYAIKSWLDDELVLDVPHMTRTPSNASYHHHYEQPRPYPFPEKTVTPPTVPAP